MKFHRHKVEWKEHFYYDSESPSGLRWTRDAANNKMKAGDVAGRLDDKGYWTVGLDGKRYRNSRVIWELHNGPIPEGMFVDHVNRVRGDNRIENLTVKNNRQNTQNQIKRCTNTSGTTGVNWIVDKYGSMYWKAQWTYMDGTRAGKCFGVARYGMIVAHYLASKYRILKIALLNSQGASYTEQHGKEQIA